MITTLIFDVGGVLLRTEDRRPRAQLADTLQTTPEALEELFFGGESGTAAQRGELPAAQHWEAVRLRLGLRPEEFSPVRDAFFGGDVLDRSLLDFVRTLRPDYRLAILSNAFDDARPALAGKFGLSAIFDPILISAEEKVVKPDPRIFRIALERCGAAPEQAVLVDDMLRNIRGAQAAGMRTVWFRGRDQAIADLKRILAPQA